jgi:O-antigen/teichoic acid export membrane protein
VRFPESFSLPPSLRRAGWAIADQAFSSLTNFALGVLVARTVDLAAFGAFSLAFAAYLIVVSITRGYPMDPLAIRYAAAPHAEFRTATSAATGTVVAVGVVFGAALMALGFVTSGPFSQALLALGLCLPGLLLQDAWRSTFFAGGRGRLAFLNDLTWAVVEFPALAILIVGGEASVFWAVIAWGGGATVAAVAGILQARCVPRPWLALSWWREHIDLGPRFIAEAMTRVLAGQVQLYGVGFVAGLATVGALRAGQLLFGPVQVISFGVNMMAVPEGARALAVSLGRLRRTSLIISAGLAAAAAAWGIMLLIMPASLGDLLLRGAWGPAHALFLPILLASLANMLMLGAGIGIRSLAAAARSLRATIVTSTLTLVMGIGGAAVGGAAGSAWGLFLVAVVGLFVWWYQYGRAMGERRAGVAVGGAAPDDDSIQNSSSAW